MKEDFKVLFVNYNVQEFIHIAIKSLRKFHPNCVIYVFDNSDNGTKFENVYDNVTVFDNTNGNIIPFKNIRCGMLDEKHYKDGSKMHAMTIEKCFDLINDNFLLLDTDIYVKKSLEDFIDDNYILCGRILDYSTKETNKMNRPYANIMYINVNMCKQNDIHFFDKDRIGLCDDKRYDTGASFYEDIKDTYPIKIVPYLKRDYIDHFCAGSRYDFYNKENEFKDWIEKYSIN